MRTLVLGAGKMVGAILRGLKTSQDMRQFEIYSPSGESAKILSESVGAKHVSTLAEATSPECIWLGCKPQQLPELKKILGDMFPDAIYLSFLAALPEANQLKILDRKILIRAMPNLPVEFKSGITLLASTSAESDLAHFEKLFSHLGTSLVVSENELEELTLLTGSGPAFFYEFTQYLAQSFTSLDESKRESLARQVLLGAGLTSAYNKAPLTELVSAVTSKGGVTIAVLEEWRQRHLKDGVGLGVSAGKIRSSEIKDRLRQN